MTDTIQERLEYCVVCYQPTGHAGAGDGSIWCTECEEGPLCDNCSVLGDDAWCVKCAANKIDRLERELAEAKIPCEWRESDGFEFWMPSCNPESLRVFETDPDDDPEWRFCPLCGRPVVLVKFEDLEASDD